MRELLPNFPGLAPPEEHPVTGTITFQGDVIPGGSLTLTNGDRIAYVEDWDGDPPTSNKVVDYLMTPRVLHVRATKADGSVVEFDYRATGETKVAINTEDTP